MQPPPTKQPRLAEEAAPCEAQDADVAIGVPASCASTGAAAFGVSPEDMTAAHKIAPAVIAAAEDAAASAATAGEEEECLQHDDVCISHLDSSLLSNCLMWHCRPACSCEVC